MTCKVIIMLIYEVFGCLEWFVPLVGYTEDIPWYYLFNEIQKLEHGNKGLFGILVLAFAVLILTIMWLIHQNAGKKLLIIEHSSLQNVSFTYDREELDDYAVKRLSINQNKTINNNALPLEEKVALLIAEIDDVLPSIHEYVDKNYQIGYAGIPVGNIPSIFMLGYELDDANKKLYFHKNRNNPSDDAFHILKNEHNSIKLHAMHTENNEKKTGDLLVIVQLTQPIKNTDLKGIFGTNDYVLRYDVSGQIDYDIINSARQTNEYAQQIVSDIAEIQKRSNISKIKICIAASSDFVFALGTKFSKTQNIDIVIYQFDKDKYSWGINVTKKKAVVNELFYN